MSFMINPGEDRKLRDHDEIADLSIILRWLLEVESDPPFPDGDARQVAHIIAVTLDWVMGNDNPTISVLLKWLRQQPQAAVRCFPGPDGRPVDRHGNQWAVKEK